MTAKEQIQANVEYDPKLQLQFPKRGTWKVEKEQTKLATQISKEDYEKWRMGQIKLETQSPMYFGGKFPEEIKNSDEFLNLLKEKLKDYNDRLIGYSQECEGTFKVKDGEVTDINITGIALVPRFGDKK